MKKKHACQWTEYYFGEHVRYRNWRKQYFARVCECGNEEQYDGPSLMIILHKYFQRNKKVKK